MDIKKAIQNIPPLSIYFVYDKKAWMSKLIGWWYIITHLKWAIKMKFRVKISHAGIYVGSGKNETIETKPYKVFKFLPWGKVSKGCFLDHVKKNKSVYAFYNVNATVNMIQSGKHYAYGRVGILYDVLAFLKFVLPIIKQEEAMEICIENAINIVRYMGLTFMMGCNSFDIHPTEAYLYCISEQGIKDGWRQCFEWGG